MQVISIDIFQKEVATRGQAKIVASFADRTVSVWTLKIDGELKKKFSVTFEEGFMPKMVHFDIASGNIYVFAMNGGNVYVFYLDSHYALFISLQCSPRRRIRQHHMEEDGCSKCYVSFLSIHL